MGVSVYRKRGAHLVITDVTLTRLTGIELIVAIVRGPRPAPVIAISGADSDELEHAKLWGLGQRRYASVRHTKAATPVGWPLIRWQT